MGNSTSLKTLDHIRPHLQGLLRGEDPIIWPVKRGYTKLWAAKLREARTIAELYPEEAELFKALSAYRFHEEPKECRVVARKFDSALVESVTAQKPVVGAVASPPPRKIPPIPGAQTARSIISTVLQLPQGLTYPLHYPDAAISRADLETLRRWAEGLATPLSVIYFADSSAVTVAPYDPSLPPEVELAPGT